MSCERKRKSEKEVFAVVESNKKRTGINIEDAGG